MAPVLVIHLLASLVCGSRDTIPFSSGELAVRGGLLQPVGSLGRLVDPAAQVGLSLAMAHWGTVRTRLDLAYARLEGTVPLHFVLAGAGYDWSPSSLPLETGMSLGLFHIRNEPDPQHPRLADGGETEFGLCLRGAVPLWKSGSWTVRLEAQGQQAFTRPRSSVLGWFGLSAARRVW